MIFHSFLDGNACTTLKYSFILGYNCSDRILCCCIYPLVYTTEDVRGYFSCSLGVIKVMHSKRKLFLNQTCSGKSETVYLHCLPSHNILRKTCTKPESGLHEREGFSSSSKPIGCCLCREVK